MQLLYSIQSELLKLRRSGTFWLCLIGGVFIPTMSLSGFLFDHDSINSYSEQDLNVWIKYFFQVWRFMAIAILPITVILLCSIITQLEFRNNCWKQLHTTPQHPGVIFTAKFLIIIYLTLTFMFYFNIAFILSAIIPTLLFEHHLPKQKFPIDFYLRANAKVFIAILPVISLQYLLSLKFKNFFIPIGAGLLLITISFILVKTWKYSYISPYAYSPMLVIGSRDIIENVNIDLLSILYFILVMIISYFVYLGEIKRGL